MAWCRYYDGGKAGVTTLGHDAYGFRASASGNGAARFQQTFFGGIRSVMGDVPFRR